MKTVKEKASSMQSRVMAAMGCMVFLKPSQIWMDTKSKNLNKVLGSKKLGIPAGKVWEIAGIKHSGKTTIVMTLAGEAQKMHNAFVIWIDAEQSLTNESPDDKVFKNSWAKKLGLDTSADNFYRVYPKMLKMKKQRKKGKKVTKAGQQFIQSAEFLFDEAETVMHLVKEAEPDRPIFWALDSVANLQTEMNNDAGNSNKNMRTALDRAQFLSGALPRLMTLASNYDMWCFMINQIRLNPNAMFTDPEYSPGGKAVEHAAHVQVKIKPYKHGVMLNDDGDVIGIRGSMKNIKNKAGGGSIQGKSCGYHIDFSKQGRKMWSFVPLEELKKEK